MAGGMESMSRVPYYAPGARAGLRMGHAQLLDGMLLDGLWCAPKDTPLAPVRPTLLLSMCLHGPL